MARLVAISSKPASRAPMVETNSARITTTKGLVGDARGRPGGRQVTVLSRESWELACAELGAELAWTLRRANLLVEGMGLVDSAGMRLRVGDVLLEITGETEPCGLMEQQHAGLLRALQPDWRGGVCCRVLKDGEISVGDLVTIEAPERIDPLD